MSAPAPGAARAWYRRRPHGLPPQLPVAVVLALLAAGLLTVRLHHFRIGGLLVGVSLVVAAGLRLLLSARAAGLLVVRSRAVDVTVLVALGVAVLGLARVVPAGH